MTQDGHVYLKILSKFQRFIVSAYQSNLLGLYLVCFRHKVKIVTKVLDFYVSLINIENGFRGKSCIRNWFTVGTHSAFCVHVPFCFYNQLLKFQNGIHHLRLYKSINYIKV